MHPDRHIALDGASNFRDFGGYETEDGRQVKWRRLYRSDHLAELTADDFERLAAHRIRNVFDLRRHTETVNTPTRWAGESAPTILHTPLFTDEAGLNTFQRVAADEAARHDPAVSREMMREMYVRMVTEPTPLAALGRIFTRLAEPDAFPALFHCAGGKDRTGVTCALILSVLGAPHETVVEDFMLTQTLYDASAARKNRIAQVVADAALGFWSEEALAPIFTVQRAYIETSLGIVDEKGGAEAFMIKEAGVTAAALERLRETLVE